mgnify:CR=1 FL=1
MQPENEDNEEECDTDGEDEDYGYGDRTWPHMAIAPFGADDAVSYEAALGGNLPLDVPGLKSSISP